MCKSIFKGILKKDLEFRKSKQGSLVKTLLILFLTLFISGPAVSHDLLSEEKYNYSMKFYGEIKRLYGKRSPVTRGAARFMHHRWYQAKKDFEKVKKKDARVLFFLYTIYKAFNMEQAMNRVIDNIARIPASRLRSYEKLKKDKAVKEIIYHYYRDHLKPGNGTFEGASFSRKNRPVNSNFSSGLSANNLDKTKDKIWIEEYTKKDGTHVTGHWRNYKKPVIDDNVPEIIEEDKRFDLKKYGMIDLNSENKALFPEGHENAGKLIPADQLIELSMSLEKRKEEDRAKSKKIE